MRITRADRGLQMKDDNTKVNYWELVDSHMRLFLCGPGPHAWWPVTAPTSSPPVLREGVGDIPSIYRHGTLRERNIARRALRLLSLRFHDSGEATPEDIRATLEQCGWTADPFTTYPQSHD